MRRSAKTRRIMCEVGTTKTDGLIADPTMRALSAAQQADELAAVLDTTADVSERDDLALNAEMRRGLLTTYADWIWKLLPSNMYVRVSSRSNPKGCKLT